jgi:hypothetical protein
LGEEMGFIEIPDSQILRDEEAIRALQDFILELKEHDGGRLTKKQKKTLTKIANLLITNIRIEMYEQRLSGKPQKPSTQSSFAFFKKLFQQSTR